MKEIRATCLIKDRVVQKNGETLFANTGAPMGEFLLSLYQHLGINYPRFYKMDNLSKLGWLASEILLKDSFSAAAYRPEEIGLVLSNANASLDTDSKYWETVKELPSPSLFVYTLPSIVIGEICIRNQFKGESAFFVSERFDPDLMEEVVGDMMEDGSLKVCIYGWVDLLGEEGEAILFLVERENK